MPSLVESIEDVPLSQLSEYVENPREGDVAAIAKSLRKNQQYRPIVANRGTHTGRPNEILAGNHTWKAAQLLEWPSLSVSWVDVDNDTAARIVLADNKTADGGGYNEELLRSLLQGLPDLEGTGYSDDELQKLLAEGGGSGRYTATEASLADRFGVPPFTVISARSGEWQARKKVWLDLGIQSEVGREGGLVYSTAASFDNWYELKNVADAEAGRKLTDAEFMATPRAEALSRPAGGGTSVFDPALTELMYRWFSVPGGSVIDPWAGGSVRGIVAGAMGREYTGIELRPEQVEANRLQLPLLDTAASQGMGIRMQAQTGQELPERATHDPLWVVGESTEELAKLPAESYDFALGCPPYYDLEKYSDDPRDLSTMTPADFDSAMTANIAALERVLRPDSFAVFVVGAVRDKNGHILDMRRCMTTAAEAAGMHLYNDLILLTPIGPVRMRAARSFSSTRTVGRIHQEVLVYIKGDRKNATRKLASIDVTADLDLMETDDDAEDDGTGV